MHVPGQLEALDSRRRLVRTSAYPRFQAQLQSRYPFLMLAMDREDGLWCIVRRDVYRRRASLGFGEAKLCYGASVFTPVMHLEYVLDATDPEDGNRRVFLHPGNWVFRVLARMHPAHLGFDNTKQVRREMIERDLARRRRLREQRDARIEAEVADWSKHVSLSDPYRFKPSVMVSKP